MLLIKPAYVLAAIAVLGLLIASSASGETATKAVNKKIDGRIAAYMRSHPSKSSRVVYVEPTGSTLPMPTYAYTYPATTTYGYYGSPVTDAVALGAGTLSTALSAPLAVAGVSDGVPLQNGRSAAILGGYCTTPIKTCELIDASYVGLGCSCAGPRRSYGEVTQ